MNSDVTPLRTMAHQVDATFHTETFIVAPLTPPKLRELASELLQGEHLAEQLEWMKDKSKDGALREAFLLQVQCAAGDVRAWEIVERGYRVPIGAVLVREDVAGLDIELLCQSASWNDPVANEVVDPLMAWLEGRHETFEEVDGLQNDLH